ncbi:DUF6157 family protein [soil metagenome]
MDYFSTFIAVSPDTSARAGTVPAERGGNTSIAMLEYELIAPQPYVLRQSEVLFAVHVWRRNIPAADVDTKRPELWQALFSKPLACMRTSPLAKIYGWGLHFDEGGKVALVGMETATYGRLRADTALHQKVALRRMRG